MDGGESYSDAVRNSRDFDSDSNACFGSLDNQEQDAESLARAEQEAELLAEANRLLLAGQEKSQSRSLALGTLGGGAEGEESSQSQSQSRELSAVERMKAAHLEAQRVQNDTKFRVVHASDL